MACQLVACQSVACQSEAWHGNQSVTCYDGHAWHVSQWHVGVACASLGVACVRVRVEEILPPLDIDQHPVLKAAITILEVLKAAITILEVLKAITILEVLKAAITILEVLKQLSQY